MFKKYKNEILEKLSELNCKQISHGTLAYNSLNEEDKSLYKSNAEEILSTIQSFLHDTRFNKSKPMSRRDFETYQRKTNTHI